MVAALVVPDALDTRRERRALVAMITSYVRRNGVIKRARGSPTNRWSPSPGFDNETFIQAMAVSEEGISWLWRR